jgi:hypothetical protein
MDTLLDYLFGGYINNLLLHQLRQIKEDLLDRIPTLGAAFKVFKTMLLCNLAGFLESDDPCILEIHFIAHDYNLGLLGDRL